MPRILPVLALAALVSTAFASDGPGLVKRKELALPGATGFDLLSVNAPARRLLVAHSTRVEVVDLDSGEKVGSVEGIEGAHQAVLLDALKTGFVTEGKKNKVASFDAGTLRVGKEIEVGDGPDALLFVATTSELWVMNHKAGTITCVDPKTLEVRATIDVGGKLELAAEYVAKGLVFVNVEDRDSVVAIDAKTHAVTARDALDPAKGPTGIAVDEKDGVLWCGCDEKLARVDAATGKVTATAPIGKHCDSVAYDAERGLAFASCGDGTTAVVRAVSPTSLEVVQTLQTAPGGKTCALDPTTHALWVAAGTRGKDDLRLLQFAAPDAK